MSAVRFAFMANQRPGAAKDAAIRAGDAGRAGVFGEIFEVQGKASILGDGGKEANDLLAKRGTL